MPDWLHNSLINSKTGGTISWRLDPFEMIKRSLLTGSPLGDCLSQIALFRRIGAPVPLCAEETQAALNEMKLDAYDADMLVTYNEDGLETHLQKVTAFHLVQTAGRLGWTLAEAHQRFARLVPIGLELGYPSADVPDELVYWYDLQALTTYFDGQPPVISGSIDNCYLRHAAEEIFHETPSDELQAKVTLLRDRLRVFAPLFASGYHILEEGSRG